MGINNEKGIWGKWFKIKKRGCCNVKIEEIDEAREDSNEAETAKEAATSKAGEKPRKPCCG